MAFKMLFFSKVGLETFQKGPPPFPDDEKSLSLPKGFSKDCSAIGARYLHGRGTSGQETKDGDANDGQSELIDAQKKLM